MRNYLEINGDNKSYFGIIQSIWKRLTELSPLTDEGQIFIDSLSTEFKRQIDNNEAPLLYIGGKENQTRLKEFYNSDNVIYEFGKFVSESIKHGDNNLLLNICAEEHFLKTGTYPDFLENELNKSSTQIINSVIADEFYGLISDLYENIKSDYASKGLITINQTKNTYNNVIAKIKEHFINYSDDLSIDAKDYIENNFNKIFESSTPILQLKEFKTNAQQVIPHDKKFMEVLKFVDKNIKESPSLNLLINIAKEEHLQNTNRANQPETDETINKLKDYWTAGDSEIEQAIKNGIFDELQSELMMELRSDYIPEGKNQIIKPSQKVTDLYEAHQNLQVFSPIGLLTEDTVRNQKVAIIEDNLIDVNETENGFEFKLSNIQISDLPEFEKIQFLNKAVRKLSYNPEDNSFSPNLTVWDFNILINNEGDVLISDSYNPEPQIVDLDDLPDLFSETINLIDLSDSNISHQEMIEDADNFIVVANNYDKIVLFDDLIQLQGLDNEYAIVTSDSIPLNESEIDLSQNKQLQFVTGSQTKQTISYKTYEELINNINKNIGLNSETDVRTLFNQSISKEQSVKQQQIQKIEELKKQQKELNQQIQNKQNLMKIAEQDSPAYQKLNQELSQLNENLDINLNRLNKLINP